jgi:aryl carrier-like protein
MPSTTPPANNEDGDTLMTSEGLDGHSQHTSTTTTSRNKKFVTIKDSMEVISELIGEIQAFDDEEIPSQRTVDNITPRPCISGYYHISTSIAFEDLCSHPTISHWLHLHGYFLVLSKCQSSDMVKIGFLTRVRSFT